MSSEELFNQFDWRVTLDTAPLPDGREKKSVRVHRCDSVHILPFVSEDKVLLIHEFRPFYQEYIWMVPSGKADKESDILTAAQRELREETGYQAAIMTPYGRVNLSDTITITNHLFLARDLSHSPLPQDPDELIRVESMTVQEAIEKVLNSPRVHTPSGFLLLKYAREKGL
ncbi:MAG TPA: NUDIX hydrolase [Candidatus Peribacteraceae bacterium]|nr:NUDIX hydrolase [Candidatus Peribacteraceae bacterium]